MTGTRRAKCIASFRLLFANDRGKRDVYQIIILYPIVILVYGETNTETETFLEFRQYRLGNDEVKVIPSCAEFYSTDVRKKYKKGHRAFNSCT